jgi:hypothetical protein
MVFGLYSDRNSWVIYIPLPLPGLNFWTHICLYPADIWFWKNLYTLCVAAILKSLYSPNGGWNLWSLVRSFINGLWILVNEILAWLTFLEEYFFSPYTENLGLQFRFITDFIFGFGGVLLDYFSGFCFRWWDRQTSPGFPFFVFLVPIVM